MRKLLIPILCAFIFLLFSKSAFGAGEFVTDTSINYDVAADGKTTVTHTITVENVFTDVYATSYSLNLHAIKPGSVEGFEGNKALKTEVQQSVDKTTINVQFEDARVGRGQKRTFNIRYTDDRIVTRTGEVWEAFIPKLSDPNSFNSYSVNLFIPQSLGELAYVTPQPSDRSVQGTKNVYSFGKEALVASPIKAAFGKFQVFSMDLTYHLENPLNKQAYIEVAVPPDTQYQKVIIQSLEPKPAVIYTDQDGNWLAKYILSARQRLDVKLIGSVQLFADARGMAYDTNSLHEYLQPTAVWQADDPAIKALAQKLLTPRAIYDYVVNTLEYNYDRAKPNVSRLGASEAFKNPKNAICMEFTDLFIALARAAGIPAREINGFAYTENPQIQPLSLVSDVLHSWPEYWDTKKGAWVPIDPTWGSTTGGLDYFSKLDLRHVAFVIHGRDPYKPYPPGSYKLGPNPQKDVFVSFGQLPESRDPKAEIVLGNTSVNISNSGKSALSPFPIEIYFDMKKVGTFTSKDLPPFGQQEIRIPNSFSWLGYTMPKTVTIVAAGQTISNTTGRSLVIAANIIAVMAIVALLVGTSVFLYKRAHKVFSFKNFPK